MSRQIPFDPATLRKKDTLVLPEIPINHYVSDVKKELKTYGKERLIRAYYDMLLIRKFETMLDMIKKEGCIRDLLQPPRSRPPLRRPGKRRRRAGDGP